ncbi:cytochrome P450 [Ganoderma sinense ZZ0214-1]|uniref:Cytochrome P450 n=1 Tax=Ganoderma sinense ZZ0214-1 TaxID=1077348 RepID=A0A2G8S6Y1_9APHY|nr:cytochrome P450 [Ganoderma sinense ZZ0214-1]
MLHPTLLLLIVGTVVFGFLLRQRMKTRPSLLLPPGPPALPLIGNVLDIPSNGAPGFHDLCQKYGDIVHLNIAGKSMIILGSQQAASELLDKRSLNYSDRPPPYGGNFFNQTAVLNYATDQRLEAHRLVMRLVDKPEAFLDHIGHMFGSSIMRVVYGLEVDEEPVDYLKMAEETMAIFSETLLPGKYIIEFLQFLRYLPSWVPGAAVKSKGPAWRQVVWRLVEEPWKFVMTSMREGAVRPSMAASLMADVPQSYGENTDVSEEEELFRSTSATAYAVFFLAMVTHPQALQKAQAELDTVVGSYRLPDFEDMKSLPYIRALMKELFRWRVSGPLGFPHCAVEDDEYRGYRIPKGAILVANIWAVSRDPNVYPDPDVFMPERFLKDGELNPDVRDPATFAFGYGRRICPGRHYVASMLFIVVTTVLHTLSITAPLDKDGNPVHLEGKMMPGLVASRNRHPEPFECVIKPRSEEAIALVRRALETS